MNYERNGGADVWRALDIWNDDARHTLDKALSELPFDVRKDQNFEKEPFGDKLLKASEWVDKMRAKFEMYQYYLMGIWNARDRGVWNTDNEDKYEEQA